MSKRYRRLVAFAVLFIGIATWVFTAGGQQPQTFVPREVIVKMKDSTPPAEALAVRLALNATVKKNFKAIGAELWTISGVDVQQAVNRFENDPRVLYIEPNYIVQAVENIPNDPRFNQLWGMHNTGQTGGTPDADIDAPEAWDLGTGGTVIIGNIDTGVDYNHQDLAANIYSNPGETPGNGIDDDGNGYIDDIRGWDFVNNDNNPMDDNGHGTHTAGTSAAVGNNGIGVVGVSWTARIMPLKFLNAGGSGTTDDAIEAVLYANMMGAQVTNNSWGGGGFSQALKDAIDAAGNLGYLFCAAAGNFSSNNDNFPFYPATYDSPNIIAVASTDHNDNMSGFSNFGLTTVDLGAPGSDILSTFPGNVYGTISGTSMATPHVSGAVSLLWAAAPTMTNTEVKNTIMASVDVIPALVGRTVTGGRLNVFNILSGLDDIPPDAITDLAVASTGSSSAVLNWTATGDDGSVGTASSYDVRYSTSPIDAGNFDSATQATGEPAPNPSGSAESFEVFGLSFNTTYYFAIVAVDEQQNRSDVSNSPSGTTLGEPNLVYDPTSFSADLLTGGTDTQTMTISNTGEGTLDWSIPSGASAVPNGGPQGAPLPSWLSANPSSGRVYAGESVDVSLTFDATGLNDGDYDEVVSLMTNDPDASDAPITAHLHVTGAPDVSASPLALNYGQHYTGTCSPLDLTVTNVGTKVLVVSGLSISNPAFTCDGSGFNLAPGASRVIAVSFCPTTVSVETGTLSINSDDPDTPSLDVSLSGEGVAPPIIGVDPASLHADLYVGGTETQQLTISNTGGSDLSFTLDTEFLDLVGASASIKQKISIPRSDGNFPRGQYQPSAGAPPKDGQATTKSNAPPVTLAAVGSSYSSEEVNFQNTRFNLNNPEDLELFGNLNTYIWAADFAAGDQSFLYAVNDLNQFMTIDTTTGAQTILGSITPEEGIWTGMAWDPVQGVMYAVTTDIFQSGFYVIDITVPSATKVGMTGMPGLIAVAVDDQGAVWSYDLVTDEFVSIDPTTGAGTPVGSLGFDANYGQGMSFDPETGQIYLSAFNNATFQAELRIADRTTGNTTLVGVLGQNTPGGLTQLGWLGIPGAGLNWLALDPEEGIVPAGGSTVIDVTFDANGLYGGDYAANILVSNNDPFNSEVIVPATLHVTGAPDIDLSETSLDYGQVFINGNSSKTIKVSNKGTDLLTIGSISSDLGDFSADQASMSIPPGTNQILTVTFAPTSTGVQNGTLTLSSDDPDEPVLYVALSGEGIMPPIIGWSPTSFEENLFTGEQATHTLTLTNTGASNLTFSIGIEEVVAAASGGEEGGSWALRGKNRMQPTKKGEQSVSSRESHARQPIQPKNAPAADTAILVIQDFQAWGVDMWTFIYDNFGISATVINSFQVGSTDFDDFDLIITVGDQGFDYYNAISSNVGKFEDFVSGGGVVQYQLATQGDNVNIVGGAQVVFDQLEIENNVVDPSHPIVAGLPAVLEGNYANHTIITNLPGNANVITETTISGDPTTVEYKYGLGRVIATGMTWEYLWFNGYEAGAMLGNAVAYSIEKSGTQWLLVEPTDGVVAPGASIDLTVTFDATGLYGGDYSANIVVENNDPLNQTVLVPALLHVTGAPDIALDRASIDYGVVFIDGHKDEIVVLENVGTDMLNVTSLATDHGDYSVSPTSVSLPPEGSVNLVVTYAPTTSGPSSATLTVTSDDPDEPVLLVALQGVGTEPPIIGYSPTSFHADLFTGETDTQTLTITNTGVADLEFAIALEEATAAASPSGTTTKILRGRPWLNHTVRGGGPSGSPPEPSNSRATYPHVNAVPKSAADDPAILVIQNWDSWGVFMDQFIYDNFGLTSTVINSTQIGSTDFNDYDLVITCGSQGFDYYQALSNNVGKFEDYVQQGGVLQYQCATQGDNVNLAGGVLCSFEQQENFNTVMIPDHPIVAGLPNQLEGNWANHNVLLNLPGGTAIITQTTNSGGPTTVEYEIGSGTVIATGMTWEFLYNNGYEAGAMLGNAVMYSLSAGGVGWLTVEPAAGTVPSGGSMDLAVTFDATGLYGGDYAANIIIENNDPLDPAPVLPATLHVTGAPDIVVDHTSLDYGLVFVGGSKQITVNVLNDGTDMLNVTSIVSDEPDYTVSISSFSLAPEASQDVVVTFTPSVIAPINGTLTLSSDDPDEGVILIPMTGEGLEAPIISVSPASFHKDLFTGEIVYDVLSITNSGGNNLEFSIDIENLDTANGPTATVKQKISIPRSNGDFPRGQRSPSAGMPPANGTGQRSTERPIPMATLGSSYSTEEVNFVNTRFNLNSPENLDLFGSVPTYIWAGDFASGDQSFVYAVNDQNQFMTIDTTTGAQTILGNIFPQEGIWTGMAWDPVEDVMYATTTDIFQSGFYRIDIEAATATKVGMINFPGIIACAVDDDGAVWAYDLVTDELVSIDPSTGAGTAVGSLGFDANYGQGMGFDAESGQLYLAAFNNFTFQAELRIADRTTGNTALVGVLGQNTPGGLTQLGWLGIPGLGGVSWLAVNPESGVVPPGTTVNLVVTFDATGLFGGDYAANINVENNDPLNPLVVVPATLHVTGAPDIAVDPTALDYGEVFLGVTVDKTVEVSNPGTDVLTVSSIATNHPEYSVDISNVVLNPGDSQILTVTFAPTTVGVKNASLTLQSDDPDEPSVVVSLTGDGVEPPIISTEPTAYNETVEKGHTKTVDLAITNSGGSNLTFELRTQEVGALGPSAAVKQHISIPRSKGDYPRGAGAPSFGMPPRNGKGTPSGAPPVTMAAIGSAYSTEEVNFANTRFNLNDPENLDLFGSVPTYIWAGDFASGDNSFYYAVNDLNQFMTIDTTTGAQTILGNIIPQEGIWTGMAWDPVEDVMYATTTDIFQSGFYRIDIEAATATKVGMINFPGIIACAVDDDGAVWAYDLVTDELVSIDPSTGAGTSVGLLGFDANYGQGMAFDKETGQLYLAAFNNFTFQAELRVADRTTGSTALVGVLGQNTPGGLVQLGWLGIPGLGGVRWLVLDPTEGVVPPGTTVHVDVTFDATDLEQGDYAAEIVVINNDPTNSNLIIPVALKVTGPVVPVLIQSFNATAMEGGINLDWEIFADEEISGFKIYRDTDGGKLGEVITSKGMIPSNVRTYTDESVAGGKTYRYTLAAVLPNGNEITSPIVTAQAKKFVLALNQNTPNPFNPQTRISFTLPQRDRVVLNIYDVKGALVTTLMDEEVGEGKHERVWNGTDMNGSPVSSGMYFYRLNTGKQTMTKKMMLLK